MKKIIITNVLIWTLTNISAQISTNELPFSFTTGLSIESSDTKYMPELDMLSIEKEDLRNEDSNRLVRFGYSHKVNYNLENSGTWESLPNGDRIWHLGIVCPNAISINLIYDKFWIPEGGKLFIFSSDKKQSIGAFTHRNNKGDRINPRGFATGLLYNDKIILEYYQPICAKSEPIISISSVVHGYRNIDWSMRQIFGFGHAESCQININCSEGDNWQDEKRAVARILIGEGYFATGALVNSTNNATTLDYPPLFLTAHHVLEVGGDHDAIDSPIIDDWIFYWNYEASGCNNPSIEPTIYSTVGATVLANNEENADFALLQLTEDPIGYNPYYLGWDNSGNSGTGGVCIHHPHGDIKKISTYTMTPESSDNDETTIINSSGTCWRIRWAATTNGHGTTLNCSSGSPLLNNNHKVIGQLRSGYSYCGEPYKPDWFGKFSVSWTGNGDSIYLKRLNYWLDPLGSSTQTLNGAYRPILSISGPNKACSSTTYSVNNIGSNLTVVWAISNVSGITLLQNSPSANQCTLTGIGTCDLSATIYRGSNYVTSLYKNNISIGNPALGISILFETSAGIPGCWASNQTGNTFTIEDNKYWAYNRVEAKLYRLDNNFNPSQLIQSWYDINTTGGASINGSTSGWYLLKLRGVGDCGYSDWLEQEIEMVDFSLLNFLVDYDSSSEILTITLIDPSVEAGNSQSRVLSSSYDIQIWNSMSMVRSQRTDLSKYQFSIAGLPSGIYIVRIIMDGKTYSRKFVKR